jgi:hypothetical protein
MNLERVVRAAGSEPLAACAAKLAGSKLLVPDCSAAGCRSPGAMRPIRLELASPGHRVDRKAVFLNLARVATSYSHSRTKIYQQFIGFA